LDDVHVHDISAVLEPDQRSKPQTLFHTSEIELEELTSNLQDVIERVEPDRAVIDSISEIRTLAQLSPHYRRQIMELGESLSALDCTTLLSDRRRPTRNGRSRA
jgi:circadian clock protein KaiC